MNDPYHVSLPLFPDFAYGDKDVDGLIPACRVEGWQGFQNALEHDFFNRQDVDLVYRGHRRHEWQLTPTLGRFAPSGVIQHEQTDRQLEEFRYAMRGRGAQFAANEDRNELWAYGQHYGLATPLLDWTESPYVALFFAFSDADQEHEQPNTSRPIFVLNTTSLRKLSEGLFIEPMRGDHTRLINQAGLFTISPLGEKTIVTYIMDLLHEHGVDAEDPSAVAEHLCKIHVPNDVDDRRACLRSLRLMNIHHGTLFPDAIGASLYCNTWFGSRPPAAPIVAPPPLPPASEIAAETEPETPAPIPAQQIPADFAALLSHHASADLPLTAIDAQLLSEQIQSIVRNEAGPDWHLRSNSQAAVRVSIRKLLRSKSWPVSHAAETSIAVVKSLVSHAEQH